MKAVNIIKETVEYYSKNPRGITDNYCEYYTNEGAMCAVARCLKINEAKKLKDYKGDVSSLISDKYSHSYNNFENSLKSKYKGKNIFFWQDLQKFHDDGNYWINNNLGGSDLTVNGKKEYQRLIELYQ